MPEIGKPVMEADASGQQQLGFAGALDMHPTIVVAHSHHDLLRLNWPFREYPHCRFRQENYWPRVTMNRPAF
jgi:hypothetical protein